MERRMFLTTAGTGLIVGLAGCSSDDPDYEDGNGGNGASDEDVEITEHELVIEEEGFVEDVYVEGIVENNSDEMLDYVEVSVRVYDEEGNQIGSSLDNTNDLGAGNSWAFEVMIFEDAEDVDSYDIALEEISF